MNQLPTLYQENIWIDQTMLALRNNVQSPLTAAAYESDVNEFLFFWQENQQTFPSITAALDAWKQERLDAGLRPQTINRKLSAIRRFFHIAGRENYVPADVAARVEAIDNIRTQGKRLGNWLDNEGINQLLNLPDRETEKGRRDFAVLAILVGCALRRSEVVGLRWGQLVRHGSTWILQDIVGKHRHVRSVPVPGWVYDAILDHSERGEDGEYIITNTGNRRHPEVKVTPQTVYSIVKEYAGEAGLEFLAPHDLRRTTAKIVTQKMGIRSAQRLLGHQSERTTEIYVDDGLDFEATSAALDDIFEERAT